MNTITYMMKSQSLYNSFSIPNTNITTISTTKLSSFNFPSFSGKGNSFSLYNISPRNDYWVIKSHHKEDEITVGFATEELKMSVVLGAATIGLVLFLMGQEKAWALGPEGPLVEEFWENVRRYALYALTVSTGVIYTVLQPIIELLKNPISAVLIVIIIGGSFFIVSQILSAMVGVSEFSYQYAY